MKGNPAKLTLKFEMDGMRRGQGEQPTGPGNEFPGPNSSRASLDHTSQRVCGHDELSKGRAKGEESKGGGHKRNF
ncbi:hypothetical protein NL676_035477 [Syzygium grande]|nr:hypothetical protein NL676_035477 [Syzygium grande]